jgi:hypothetical protein
MYFCYLFRELYEKKVREVIIIAGLCQYEFVLTVGTSLSLRHESWRCRRSILVYEIDVRMVGRMNRNLQIRDICLVGLLWVLTVAAFQASVLL